MGKLIDYLKATAHLPLYATLKRGTLIDQGSSALGALVVSGTPTWRDTDRGNGLFCPAAGTNNLSAGNPASLQIANGTIFAVATRTESSGAANFNVALVKSNAFGLYFNWTAEPKVFGAWDFSAGAWRASTFAEGLTGIAHLYAITFQSGVVNGTTFYVDGIARGVCTITILNQASPVVLGYGTAAGQGLGGPILVAGISDLVLTGAQHAELWDQFLQEGWVKNLARRNFVYQYPAKRASEYAAAGIFFDTPEKRRADGKIIDLTENYTSTLFVGVPIPTNGGLHDECGVKLAVSDETQHGNMAQLNAPATLTWDGWVEFPSGNIPATSWWLYNNAGGGVYFVLGNGGGPSTNPALYLVLGAGSANTSVPVLRAGTKQHIALTYNAGVVKFYVDGEPYVTTVTAAIPNPFPNFSASTMRVGVVCNYTSHMVRARTPLLTDAQVRAEYLKTGAQHLTLRETLEDVPVTLAASVAAPGQIGSWRLISGSWKCSETSDGKRWLECVTAGTVALQDTNPFGTKLISYWRPLAPAGNLVVMYNSVPDTYIAAGAIGYAHVIPANGQYQLIRYSGGGVIGAWLIVGAVGQLASNAIIELASNRRPSDGRFTVYDCLYGTAWALSGAGGGTFNPTVADAVYTTCAWLTVTASPGDKILLFDPRNPNAGLFHWQGQLNPIAEELPR